MENGMTPELIRKIADSLTDEQKEKAKACKSAEELLALVGKESIELPDEMLNAVSGGCDEDEEESPESCKVCQRGGGPWCGYCPTGWYEAFH